MKNKEYIFFLLLLILTLLAAWIIPAFLHKATEERIEYPFACYSSVIKELCFIEFRDEERPMHDKSGRFYNEAQFDSITPLLHFRQLMMDGTLPDSIDGRKIDFQSVREKTFVFRYNPAAVHAPETGLHLMYESTPLSVDLEYPEDVFSIDEKIRFICAETNREERQKSRLFQEALVKEGFAFPPRWLSGNPSPNKSYDEGYFCLDNEGQLFHLKMVNNRPFILNTHLGDSLSITSFSMAETGDRRFYGFLFDTEGGVYIVENEKGNYRTVQLAIDPFDPTRDELFIMGNLLYWTVTVTTPSGVTYYGLDTETLKRVDDYRLAKTPDRWDKASGWLFPYYVRLDHPDNSFIYPSIVRTGWKAFAVNLLLALSVFFFVPAGSSRRKIFRLLYLLLTGIAGLAALLLLPGFRKEKVKE